MLRRLFHSLFLLIHLSVLAQSTLFVDENSMDNKADGLSWNSAFDNLQDALFEARSNSSVSEIWIAVGSYHPMKGNQYPDRTIDNFWAREISFNLVDGVALFGGFRAGQTSKDERNQADYNQTILTGYDPDYDSYASFTVVRGDDLNQTVTLDGLCIQRGKSDGYKENTIDNDARNFRVEGAGLTLYDLNASVILKNCTFLDNQTKAPQDYLQGGQGGACLLKFRDRDRDHKWQNKMALRTITLSNCLFLENNASGQGGAVAIYKPSGKLNLSVNACSFSSNFSGGYGGALSLFADNGEDCTVEIVDSNFSDNYSLEEGGALCSGLWKTVTYELRKGSDTEYEERPDFFYSDRNNISLNSCNFIGNTSRSNGGAVYAYAYLDGRNPSTSNVSSFDSNFIDNYSFEQGGAIHSQNVSSQESNFTDNFSLEIGGAIATYATGKIGSVNLIKSNFLRNDSNTSGGAANTLSLEAYDSNFTDNTAGQKDSYGGAIECSETKIFNCRFIRNTAGNGGALSIGAIRTTINDFEEYERPMRHIVNCVFEDNTAFFEGGGLHFHPGSIYNLTPLATAYPYLTSISNSIFLANKALRGGGVSGFSTLINCLFVNNEAQVSGAVFCPVAEENSLEYVALTNCISWNNYSSFYNHYDHGFWNNWNLGNRFQTSPARIRLPRADGDPLAKGFDPAELLSTVNQTPILAQNFDDENLAFSADPLFININDPDGPDNIWFTADDGLRLSSLSPGINAGNSYYLSFDGLDIDGDSNIDEVIPFDALGNPRIAGATVDLGPYELIKLKNPGTQVDGSLYFLDWFGYYQGESETGWYYHYPSKQWCYIFNWDTSGMFIYFNNLGWGWTNQSISPYFYLFTSEEWVFFDLESGKGYYDFAKSGWQSF